MIAAITFFAIGVMAALVLFFPNRQTFVSADAQPAAKIQNTTPENSATTNEDDEIYSSLLDDIWIKSGNFSGEGISINKKCVNEKESFIVDNCELRIFQNQKQLAKFTAEGIDWLQYGFFNFLGKKNKQLVIYTYSGGAHCCDDYVIYDLKPAFRVIYDSRKYDSGSEIGNTLKPVDIDKDGIFEFEQDVMAFDYFFASHADSIFPPVVFAYDQEKGMYEIANKKHPDFVMDELKKNLDWLRKQRKDETETSKGFTDRYILRKNFINLVYAGKEEQAWEYYDRNYNLEDKAEQKKAFKEIFSKEIVYKSIYKSPVK